MLELITAPSPHVIAMHVSGCITADELQHAIDAIEQAKQDHDKVSIYTEVDHWRWMTGTALVRDIGYALTQFGRLHHFHRAAVVSDQQWLRTLATVENQLFKSIEVRSFAPDEKDTAMKWVCELPDIGTPQEEHVPAQTR